MIAVDEIEAAVRNGKLLFQDVGGRIAHIRIGLSMAE